MIACETGTGTQIVVAALVLVGLVLGWAIGMGYWPPRRRR